MKGRLGDWRAAFSSFRPGWSALAWLCLPAALVVVTLACTGSAPTSSHTPSPTATPAPTPTPTPPPDPRALLHRAAHLLQSEESLGFTMHHPVGSTPLATGLLLTRAEGVAALPNRFQLNIEIEASGTVFLLGIVVVDDQAYMTNLFSGEWEPAPREQLPFRLESVVESVSALLEAVENPVLLAGHSLEGQAVHYLQGTAPTGTLTQLIPGALPDATIPVQIWLGEEDGRLRQVELTGELVADDHPDTVRVVALEFLDAPPEIEDPEVDEPEVATAPP